MTVNAGGTWNNSGNAAVEFRGGITKNASGTFTAGSGMQSFNVNTQTLTGTFTIPSITITGVTLTNINSLTIDTALAGTGGLTQATDAVLNLGGTSTITTLTASANPNTVTYNGKAQTINSGTYHNLTVSGLGTNRKTLAGATVINGKLTISSDTLSQGASYSIQTGDSLNIAASGILYNVGTGALTLGGNLLNSGKVIIDGSGVGCGGADAILIRSTNTTVRNWNGTGLFTIKDVDIQDMTAGTAITAYSSTNSGNVTGSWTVNPNCPDTIPPSVGTMTIADNNGFTKDIDPVFIFTSVIGADSMRFALNDSSSGMFLAWKAYNSTDSMNVTGGGQGGKRVWAQFKDIAGNLSPKISDSTNYDITPPAVGTMTITDNNGFTKDIDPLFTFSGVTGADSMRYAVNDSVSFGSWKGYSATDSMNLTSEGGKRMWAQFKDLAGNLSAKISDSTNYDNTAPTGSTISIVDNGGYTNDMTPDINLFASGADSMHFQVNEAAYTQWIPYNILNTNLDISIMGQGPKKIYVEFKDKTGNISVIVFDSTVFDNNPPSVGPSNIISPNGGEIWQTNTSHNILWNNGAISDVMLKANPVRLEYSTDSTNWNLIADNEANDGVFSWTPTLNHNTVKVRIIVKDSAGNTGSDISNASFMIDNMPPSMTAGTLTSPNGGEVWAAGSVHSITWNNSSITDWRLKNNPITLEYTVNGTTWNPIAANESNDGVYPWTVAAENSATVKVRIGATDSVGFTSYDTSNANFTINNIAPTVTITSTAPNLTNVSPIGINITFSEFVRNFVPGDVQVTNGSLSGMNTSDSILFTANITPSADGLVTVNIKDSVAQNMAGKDNIAAVPLNRTFDATAPTGGTIAIVDNAGFTKDMTPDINLFASSADSMHFQVNSEAMTPWIPYNTFNTNLDISILGQGQKIVRVEYKDRAGNISTSVSDTTILDNLPPTVGSITIADNNGLTKDIHPAFTFSGVSGADSVRYGINDSVTLGAWKAYAATDSISLGADGGKRVWAQFRDFAGNLSVKINDSTYFDATAPTGGTIAIMDNNGYTNDMTPDINLFASGADSMHFQVNAESWMPWMTYNVFNTNLDISILGQGQKIIRVEFKDKAGNIGASVYDTTVFDNIAPDITSNTLTSPNGGEVWAAMSMHNITWNNPSISDIHLKNNPITLEYTFNGTTWNLIANNEANDGVYPWTVAPVNSATVKVRIGATDSAGLTSYDTSNAYFTINNSPPTVTITSASSNPTNVSPIGIAITFSEFVRNFAPGGVQVTNGTLSGINTADSVLFTANITPTSDGLVTVNVKDSVAQNIAGKNNIAAVPLTRTFDATAPTATMVTIVDNNGFGNIVTPMITLSASGADSMCFNLNGGGWTPFEGYATSKSNFNISAGGDGLKKVYVQFKDKAGNSAAAIYDSTMFDATAPIAGTITIVDNNGFTKDIHPPFTFAGVSGADSVRYGVNDSVAFSPWKGYTGTDSISLGAEGGNRVWAQFKDLAGNLSVKINDSTYFDATAPTGGTIAIMDNNGYTNDMTPDINLFAIGADSMRFQVNAETPTPWMTYNIFNTNLDISIIGQGQKIIRVEYKDKTGNISAPVFDTTIFDNIPPSMTSGTLLSPNGGEFWQALSGHPITWNNASITDMHLKNNPITLEYTINGVSWNLIAGNEANDGIYPWTVAPVNSANVKVRIGATDSAGYTSYDTSNATFTINNAPPTVIITSAATEPTKISPISINIAFSEFVRNFAPGDVQVTNGSLSNLNTADSILFTANITPAADGLVTVNIKDSVAQNIAGKDNLAAVPLIRMFDTTPPTGTMINIVDNNGTGNLNMPMITLAATGADSMRFNLNGGAWTAFEGYAVSKSTFDIFSGGDGLKKVYVEFKDRAGNVAAVIFDSTLFDKTLPSGGTIAIIDNGGYTNDMTPDISLFAIGADSMHFQINADAWTPWIAYNILNTNLDISIQGQGPKTIRVEYKDKAGNISASVSGNTIFDNQRPNIGPSNLISPNGGEIWRTNAVNNILWNSGAISDVMLRSNPIKLEYSTDSTNWLLIADNEANDGIYPWTPTLNHTTVKVRISVTDSAGNSGSDVGNSSFMIDNAPPAMTAGTLTSPNGAEVWAGGSGHSITWDNASITDMLLKNNPITLEYTIDGVTWNSISVNENNDGVYSWITPAVNSATVKVRIGVTDSVGFTAYDVSNADFTISSAVPAGGTITIVDNGGYTNDMTPDLNLFASGADSMRFQVNGEGLTPWIPYNILNTNLDISINGQGVKKISVEYKNIAGNISAPASDSTIFDNMRPLTGIINITDNNGLTNDPHPAFTFAAVSGADSVRYAINDSIIFGSWKVFTITDSIVLGIEGGKRIWAQFKDLAGNLSIKISDSTYYNASSPTGGTIAIMDNGGYTNDMTPDINLFAVDVDSMHFQVNAESWTPWIAYNVLNTNLDISIMGQGQKIIRVEYKNKAGNISASVYDSTMFDNMPPQTGIINIADNNGFTNDIHPAFAFAGIVGADSVRYGINDSINLGAWKTYFTIDSVNLVSEGGKRIWAQFKDLAGNLSIKISDSTAFDATMPVAGTMMIADNNGFTKDFDPAVTFSNITGADSVRYGVNDSTIFGVWRVYAVTDSVSLGSEGGKRLWVQFKDLSGNLSAKISDSTNYDITAPTSSVIIISDNSGYTNDMTPDINLFANGADSMRFQVNMEGLTPWIAYNILNTNLDISINGQGPKTIRVEYKDNAGNISAAVSDSTILDNIRPSATMISIIDNNGTVNIKTPSIMLSAVGADSMRFNLDNGSWTPYEAYAAVKANFDLSMGGDGLKKVYVEFKDKTGNRAPVIYDSTMYDGTIPAGGTITITDKNGYTNDMTPDINLFATGADSMHFSVNKEDWTQWIAYNILNTNLDISISGQGQKIISVEYKDIAGNISAAAFDTTNYDITPPINNITIVAVQKDSGIRLNWSPSPMPGKESAELRIIGRISVAPDKYAGDSSQVIVYKRTPGIDSSFYLFDPKLPLVTDIVFGLVLVDSAGNVSNWQFDTVRLMPANLPPVFNAMSNAAVDENAIFSTVISASDPNNDIIRYAALLKPSAMTVDSVTGIVNWKPGRVDIGKISLLFTAFDGKLSDTLGFDLTVNNVNDAPVITTSIKIDSILEDSAYTRTISAIDSDAVDVITFNLRVAPKGMNINSATGKISWLPTNINVGDTIVSVVVSDSAGAKDTLDYTLHIINTNDPPVIGAIKPDSAVEGSPWMLLLSASDPDRNDVIRWRLLSGPAGLKLDSLFGLVTWTPATMQEQYGVTEA